MNSGATRISWSIKVLLVASLALNITLAVALLWHPSQAPVDSYRALPTGTMTALLKQIPTQDRRLLVGAIAARNRALNEAEERYRAAVLRALQCLDQDPLDLPQLKQAVDDARHARQSAGDVLLEAVYEALPRMSLEGRRQLIAGRFARER